MQPSPAIAAGGGGNGPRPRERLTAAQRLSRPADFDEARRLGRRVESGPFTLRLRTRTEGPRRLGVIASRKAGPAVRRNRAKRVLRELFRRHPEVLPPACDVVVIVRANFFEHSFAAIREFYLRAVRQAGQRKSGEAKATRPE
jgi:ribonuclease P protein component